MAASLLAPATLAKKFLALHPHGSKLHTQRLIIKCGATGDGWASLMDELKSALQTDLVPSNTGTGSSATPDDLATGFQGQLDQSGPAVSDTTNAAADTVSNQFMGQNATSSVVSGDAAAIAGAVPDELLRALHLDVSNPLVRTAGGALSRFDALTAGLSGAQRWALLTFLAAAWVYLTARPGVLGGAVDAYVLAPLQLALDSALGRRSLKMGDFVLGERIGEGSFGVVYYGAVVPRDGTVIEERVGRARTSLQMDDRYKEKVILKKVGNFADLLLRSPVR
jgi:hypothetical protein